MNHDSLPLYLVRLSAELTTKAHGTRKRFSQRLVANLKDALTTGGQPFHVDAQWTRIFVRTALPDAAEMLARIPGISSVSAVEAKCPATLDDIVRVGKEHFADRVQGRTYGVRARRAGQHPFSSADVMQHLGAALNPGATVDLSDPEVEVHVEVRDRWAYLFSGRTPGLGGLPLAVEGRAVCLISGGFDSAAAAWLMLKRGVELEYVFCNLAGEANERAVVEVAKVLSDRWSYGTRPRLHVIDFDEPVRELRDKTQPRFWQLILKRLMYRAAASIGREFRASAIITGESIGQVSSQTLANLRALEGASALPVFRPLLGFDKTEIVRLTERIGTYDLSARVREYCAIAPGNPITNASPRTTAREESQVDLEVLERAVRTRRTLELREINTADLAHRYLFVEEVPDDAVVIDVRPEAEAQGWTYPGAERWDQWEFLAQLPQRDREARYIIFCDQSMQSAQLAEQLQKKGVEAYAFRGGTRALRRRMEAGAAG